MNILYEEKLSTEDRKDLNKEEFGLPDERKFPLNDEKRVISAIQYFRYCKKSKRQELSKNINKRLNELNMSVKVSEDNPFYRYMDKTYLAENVLILDEYSSELPTRMIEFIRDIKIKPENYDEIITIERKFILFYNIYSRKYDDKSLRIFIEKVNKIINNYHEDYSNWKCYDNPSGKFIPDSMFAIYKDLIRNLNKLQINSKSFDLVKDYIIKLAIYEPFNFIINRSLIYSQLKTDDTERINIIETIRKEINLNDVLMRNSSEWNFEQIFYNVLNDIDNLVYTERYFEERKRENELYIIDTDRNNCKSDFTIPYNKIPNENIRKKVILLEMNNIDDELILNVVTGYTTELNRLDILNIFKNSNMKNICMGHFKNNICWYGITDNQLFYILKSIKDKKIILIEIGDDKTINSLINSDRELVIDDKITILNMINNKDSNTMLNEAFRISEDGNIKLTINSKKSYMDKYAEIHRILKENYKNKNYDAMKTNIGFMFALISIIERDKKYKNHDSELIKARAFAMNDFKTYLKHIQEIEPDFDFIKYYQENDYDKIVLNISASTIVGIKKLFKLIML